MLYNYDKLKGKIKEIFNTQEEYAKAIGTSATSINYKLNNKKLFSQKEISKSVKALNIPFNEIADYFFNQNVEINSTSKGG